MEFDYFRLLELIASSTDKGTFMYVRLANETLPCIRFIQGVNFDISQHYPGYEYQKLDCIEI